MAKKVHRPLCIPELEDKKYAPAAERRNDRFWQGLGMGTGRIERRALHRKANCLALDSVVSF